MSGSYLSLVGGLILLVGTGIAIYGAFKTSEESAAKSDQIASLQGELRALAQEALNYQTGGDAFPKVSAAIKLDDSEGAVQFSAYNGFENHYPLPDIRISITDVTGWDDLLDDTGTSLMRLADPNELPERTLSFGPETLAFLDNRPIGIMPARATDHLRYIVWIIGRGPRLWSQKLSYRLVGGQWLTATRVYGPGVGTKYEYIMPNYPRDDSGEPLW